MLRQAQPPVVFRLEPVHYWLILGAILILYALLVIPTLNRQGIGWDEEVDLRIAQAYLTPRGFFFGIPLDQTQTRLPMFSVALVYRLFGVSNLFVARLLSTLVGGLTVLGVYVFGRDRFGREVGLLAAVLLAISPFFLAFARLAFTESDVYLACVLIWFLVAVSRMQNRLSIGSAAAAGIFLGLCMSAKATVIVIIPAIWIVIYYQRNGASSLDSALKTNRISNRLAVFWTIWALIVLIAGVSGSWILEVSGFSAPFRLILYGLVCLGWLAPLGWAVKFRGQIAHPVPLCAFVTVLGFLTFIIFPPDHLTNSGILRSLFSRAENEMSLSLAFMAELTVLHLFAIIFKSTLALGVSLLVGVLASMTQWRRREILLPLFVAISYFFGLLVLPLGQTFYTIPILPLLSLFAADQFMRLWKHWRKVAFILAIVVFGWWGIETVQCYPDYHLNGYQWLGERKLFGRSSIGYRSVVYTPSDGVQQILVWLNENAESGQVAQLYIDPWHIVRYIAPDPEYVITNGFEESLTSEPDFLGVHINTLIWDGFGEDTPEGDIIRYPFDMDALKRNYEKVFVVRRAFDLEVASIWERR